MTIVGPTTTTTVTATTILPSTTVITTASTSATQDATTTITTAAVLPLTPPGVREFPVLAAVATGLAMLIVVAGVLALPKP
ncbi:MAG: hypothetical protein Q8Q52_03265 [Acidimicrobiia bacterium]|nr:hypothetical protein [Acidimicrobiia bacterium]